MKCEKCKFAPSADADGYEDECPAFYDYGKEFKDGSLGCTLTYSHMAKMEKLHDKAMNEEATDYGLEHDFEIHGYDMEKVIGFCKHFVGLDMARPYKRHGRLYYKAYRNYWYDNDNVPEFDLMCAGAFGLMGKKKEEKGVFYWLTAAGLEWLSRKTGIQIRREK